MDGYSAYRSAELADVYDAVYADSGDVDFWLAAAAEAGGCPLLELGCGTGRVTLPLARAGHQVAGIDTAEHMLARFRDRIRSEPQVVRDRVSVFEADMTSFDLDRRFGQVICTFGSFHHLRTVEQQLACLERCREHLLPAGQLVLDLINPDPGPTQPAVEPRGEGSNHDDSTAGTHDWTQGRRIRASVEVIEQHRALQCNDCEATYEIIETDGTVRRITETFPMRFIFRYELEHLLARTGYRIVELYGDYDRSPYSDESLGMIVVAERLSG